MALNTLIQTPTPPNMPNFSDKILPVNKIGDTGGTYGEGIFAGQPVNPGGFPRIPNPIQHTGVGPGHPDYQGGALQQVLPPSGSIMPIDEIARPRQIQLPPGQLLPDHNYRAMPMPDLTIGGGEMSTIMPVRPKVPDYSSQFEKFGEQLTGFGDQMTGYQDALGSFNEQVGGMGKQFEMLNNRLDSMDKGLGSLGNQIASLENMQQAQPQQVMQPQQQSYNPFGFGGFGGFGGLASLFGRRY